MKDHPRRAALGPVLSALLPLLLASCGGDDTEPPPPFDAGPVYPRATPSPPVAFEGQDHLVVDLFAAGQDFTGGSVRVQDPRGPLEILDQQCSGERCGVVLRVNDTRPNMGIPIPSPSDAEQHGLIISGGTEDYLSNLTVFPLDTITNRSASPVTIRGVVMAASVETGPDSVFEGAAAGDPIRWVVFGDADLAGTLDVSAAGAEARAGGGAGGAAAAAGSPTGVTSGPTGGAPGSGGGGGGGGASATDGEAGAGADGTPLGGGVGGSGSTQVHACASRLEEPSCGGSGAGGAGGEGGGGGGTVLIASLGALRATGASFIAAGGDGVNGGGGGAGGTIVLAAPTIEGTPTVSAAGGVGGPAASGDGVGGSGATGIIRVDAAVTSLDVAGGPAVDLSALASLTDTATVVLTGHAAPSSTVRAYTVMGDASVMAPADPADGTFSLEIPLRPGINRIAVTATADGITTRSWVGTNFELENVPALSRPVPRGATVDFIYLP